MLGERKRVCVSKKRARERRVCVVRKFVEERRRVRGMKESACEKGRELASTERLWEREEER